jgi:hypothetical protein
VTWTPLRLGENPASGVTLTTTKKATQITLGTAVVQALSWEEDDPNLSAALGDGEHAGWLRITLDDDGVTPLHQAGRLTLTFPPSALPLLTQSRAAPLTWRPVEPGIVEIRLPIAAALPAAQRPRPRQTAPVGSDDSVEKIYGIATPDIYKELVREAMARGGLNVVFLSDGNCAVDVGGTMKIMTVDDMETLARRAITGGRPDSRVAA